MNQLQRIEIDRLAILVKKNALAYDQAMNRYIVELGLPEDFRSRSMAGEHKG